MLIVDDVLSCAATAAPDRVALTLGNEALTFSQMRETANRLANGLAAWGVGRGDRVVYWADISLDAAPLQFALGRLGAVFAPLNPAYSDDETRQALEYLDPRLLIVDADHGERGHGLAGLLDLPIACSGAAGPGFSLDDLAAAASRRSPSAPMPDEDDAFTIFLTSGSTGKPKGVVISQRATWLRTYAGSSPMVTSGGGGQLVMFPLFHMAGWTFAYYAWSAHQPAHLIARADGHLLLQSIERFHPGSLYCIPAVWRRILHEKGAYDTASLEWAMVGTSRVETDLLAAITDRFPSARTTVSYGSTEVCRALSLSHDDLFRKPGSVGLPVPGVRTTVTSEGELLVRSGTLMAGYFRLPDETAQALDGGWYHTGDLAERDDEGYFTIVGRKSEMIRSGGEWIAPIEVEAAVAGYPGVKDVAVIGAPDPEWGEIVCAAVVMTDGVAPPSIDQLRRHLSGRLSSFKHPRQVIPLYQLPRTSATGQIQRAHLAQQRSVR